MFDSKGRRMLDPAGSNHARRLTLAGRPASLLEKSGDIHLVMVAFGLAIGLVFPLAADRFVTRDPGEEYYFRAISLLAGLLFYFIVKVTIYPINMLLDRQRKEWQAREE